MLVATSDICVLVWSWLGLELRSATCDLGIQILNFLSSPKVMVSLVNPRSLILDTGSCNSKTLNLDLKFLEPWSWNPSTANLDLRTQESRTWILYSKILYLNPRPTILVSWSLESWTLESLILNHGSWYKKPGHEPRIVVIFVVLNLIL